MVISIDDLPLNSTDTSFANLEETTSNLLRALEAHRVPAIGFANENKLKGPDGPDP